MIIDAFNEFSDAQAITVDAISTNVIDLGPITDNATRDIGTGEEVYFVVTIGTSLTSGDTITITLESADNEALSSNPVVHYTTGSVSTTGLTGGVVAACVRLPAGDYKRYLGVRYNVGTGPLAAGAVNAFLTKDVQKWAAYARRGDIAATA